MRQCQVPGCRRDADYEVFLSDLDTRPGQAGTAYKQDFTCLFICAGHAEENEQQAQGERSPRGHVIYPYTNQEHAQGFTLYRPIRAAASV